MQRERLPKEDWQRGWRRAGMRRLQCDVVMHCRVPAERALQRCIDRDIDCTSPPPKSQRRDLRLAALSPKWVWVSGWS